MALPRLTTRCRASSDRTHDPHPLKSHAAARCRQYGAGGVSLPELGLQSAGDQARDPRRRAAADAMRDPLDARHLHRARRDAAARPAGHGARRHARGGTGLRPAVRLRVSADLSRAALHHGVARGAVHLLGAVLRGDRRALVPAGRPLQRHAMGRPADGVHRHDRGVRRADAGVQSAAAPWRRDDGRCRALLGRDHHRDQGRLARPRVAGEDAALSARHLRADRGDRRAGVRRADHGGALGGGAGLARLPDHRGRDDLQPLVHADRQILRQPAFGFHIFNAVVRCCRRPPGAGRAFDAGLCRRRGPWWREA